MARGKNDTSTGYVSVGGRIPLELRRLFKAKNALAGLENNAALEALIRGYVDGRFVVSESQDVDVAKFADSQQTTNTKESAPADASDNALKAIRSQLGMNQRDFANALGLHQTSVSGYERGKMPTPEDVLTKARALLADDSGND